MELHDGQFVVANATDYADLDVVVLGICSKPNGRVGRFSTGAVRRSCSRSSDSMRSVRSPTASIWPEGSTLDGHGLIVVGSHVGLTNRQIDVLEAQGDVTTVVLDVDAVIEPTRSVEALAGCVDAASSALSEQRCPPRDEQDASGRPWSPEESLEIARAVSSGLVGVVRELLRSRPAWVIAKGGITSHDVLVKGLGIRRAEVMGQLFAGFVSVFRPFEALPEAIGLACVVFAWATSETTRRWPRLWRSCGRPS